MGVQTIFLLMFFVEQKSRLTKLGVQTRFSPMFFVEPKSKLCNKIGSTDKDFQFPLMFFVNPKSRLTKLIIEIVGETMENL